MGVVMTRRRLRTESSKATSAAKTMSGRMRVTATEAGEQTMLTYELQLTYERPSAPRDQLECCHGSGALAGTLRSKIMKK